MATALRGSASGGDSYTSCWMQQNCLVPFELSQPLGKGKGTPLRLWSSFSLLNKQIHKQTWQSTRSNTKHSLMFGCRACCTVKLCLIPWVFSPVLLMHSKLSVLFMWSRTSCPAHLGRHCPDWCPGLQEPLPRAAQANTRSSLLAMMQPPVVSLYTTSMDKLYQNPLAKHTSGVKRGWIGPVMQLQAQQAWPLLHGLNGPSPASGHCLMSLEAPAAPASLSNTSHWDSSENLGLKHLSQWINQKSCETLNYSWAEMTANLIDLSSLILLIGGKNSFEIMCDCGHCLGQHGVTNTEVCHLPPDPASPAGTARAMGIPSPSLRWWYLHTACLQITQPPLGTARVYSSPTAGTTSELNPTYAHRQYFFRWISAVTTCRI